VVNDFLQRLKQRKLVQWAIAYVAFAFALLQGIDIVAQRFAWPGAVERYLIVALAIGFFVVLVLTWYHGERGAQRMSGTELLILALLLAIGGTLLWRLGPGMTNGTVTTQDAMHAPASSATAVSAAITATPIPTKSIAVLPLVNGSGNQDEQYFSDGLSEDLITVLSQFDGLKVINRDSSFQFRHSKDSIQTIGEKLGVAHLLEGSVRRAGGEVRISAELVNVADGSTLWSQHYDRPYTDLFKLQDDITQAVASALKAKLLNGNGAVVQSDRPPSGNLDAYNAFLQGNAYSAKASEESMHQAIAAYTRATRLDPRYARAFAALSFAQTNLASAALAGAEQRQAYAQASTAADTALTLDTNSAAAYSARGYLLLTADFDWAGAEAAFRRALQLAPNDAQAKSILGSLLATLGQPESAVELIRQALTSDPRHATWYVGLSQYLNALGRLDGAEHAARMAIELQPGGTDLYEQLTVVEILRGDAKAALATAQQEPPGSPWHDFATTLALQIGTDRAAADAALKALVGKYADLGPYQIAEVYALRREPDRMFQWLNHAWVTRDPGIGYLLYDPFILRYKNDPRFAVLCKKVGLPVPGGTSTAVSAATIAPLQ
jgi:TolB-like protein/Flp pilus assembly protein TadD